MNKETQTTAKEQETKQEQVPSKKYEKPEIIYRAPLEAMAAVCTPTPPGKASPSCGVQFS